MVKSIKISGTGAEGIKAVKELAKECIKATSTMQTLEYTTQDKSTWGEGEWSSEPDKRQWKDEETGYPCLIVRAPVTGALCGYVGIPEKHPLYGCPYNKPHDLAKKFLNDNQDSSTVKRGIISLFCIDADNPNIDIIFNVHGSLTFSDFCHSESKPESGICHIGDEKPYWFGFDCSHAGDVSPAMEAKMREIMPKDHDFSYKSDDVYRNIAYVTAEVQSLARQLKALEVAA
jgi:hypothetical protein